ncbi:MAG: hypothetical protein M3Y22_08750 [Pseudomonadota bacterium]|nr:hypothetical protein [Pseudomonadota bacterium]
MLDDLVRYFRGKEGADFGRSLLSSVRANPLPTAVTGIGLTWLMASTPRQPIASMPTAPASSRVRVYGGAPAIDYDTMTAGLRAAEQGVTRADGEAEHLYATRLETARGQAVGLERHPQETEASFGQRIHDVLSGAKQTVVEGAHDLGDQAAGAASSLGSAAQGVAHSVGGAAQGMSQRAGGALTQGGQAMSNAGGRLIATLTENPVLLGALGLAAGALLGALLPQSDQEEAALGDIAGQARATANNLAQDVADRGSQVAQAVIDASHDSAQAEGFAEKTAGNLVDAALSGELAGNLKQVATDVMHTGDEAIRKEIPGQTENKT